MSILTVTIPIPASGDGPSIDVSALVGPKTVQLSGNFRGSYDLLASQDGADFVAVASFDAGGDAGIEQTIPGAFRSFRLRANAEPLSPISCEVSAVLGAGENGFGTIASLPAGFGGLTPVVDTSTFIPPTGSELDTCFLCRGAFQGQIVVLGSLDGIEFNPVGSFSAGTLPGGLSPTLEFSPLTVTDKVRYVRLQILVVTTGPLVVTLGGRVPASGVVTTTLSEAYANGVVASDQTLTLLDARGGAFVVDGTSPGFTGTYAVAVRGSAQVTASLTVGSTAFPTARLLLPAGTAAAGTAPLKVPPGTLLAARESGAVESDGTNLYWTDSLGTRWTLNNSASETLSQAYAAGSVAADQTLTLLDARGGAFVVDGTSPSFTGTYAQVVRGGAQVRGSLTVGSAASPTARLQLPAGTAASGTSPLKVPPGVVLSTPEAGSVEADNNHLYWTNSAGVRLQLDNSAGATTTLAQSYANGSVAAEQTLSLLDANGGGFVVDGSAVGFTESFALTVRGRLLVSNGYSVAIGVAFPTSRLHLPAGTADPGTAPLKIPSGTVLSVSEAGAVETDSRHVYWTNSTGTRLQLDNEQVTITLTQTYNNGTTPADQTLVLADVKGGRLLVDGSGPAFTDSSTLEVRQNALHDIPLIVSRYINQVPGPSLQLYHSRGTNLIPLDVQAGDEAGTVDFVCLLGGPTTLSRVVGVCIAVGPNQSALDFYTTPTSGSAALSWRMLGAGGSTPNQLVGYANPLVVPSANGTGSLGTTSQRWSLVAANSANFSTAVAVGVATPTARIHPAAGTAAAGTAPIKVPPGVVLSATEAGAIEADNNHVYWTNSAGTRLQLDNSGGSTTTLAQSYANGSAASDQTMTLTTVKGGVTVDGSGAGVTADGIGLEVRQNATYEVPLVASRRSNSNSGPTLVFDQARGTYAAPADSQVNDTAGMVAAYARNSNQSVVASRIVTSMSDSTPAAFSTVMDFYVAALGATQRVLEIASQGVGGNLLLTCYGATATVVPSADHTGSLGLMATRWQSLYVDTVYASTNIKLGGGQTVHGTDVNVAGPYVILQTDYLLQVRRTAAAAISLNLPSIATVGNGFVIGAKDSGYNAAVHNITWVRNGGDTIENMAGNYVQIVTGSTIWLVANATTSNWEIV